MSNASMASGEPMMAGAPMIDAPMIAASMDPSIAAPFGSDPQAAALESLDSNPAPRKIRRMRRKDKEPTMAAYPLPDFGGQSTAWVPTGSISGQQAMGYQPSMVMAESNMMTQSMPQIAPPQMAESINSPYVSNNSGMPLVPQADPAHFMQSNPEMTAGVPTVDPH